MVGPVVAECDAASFRVPFVQTEFPRVYVVRVSRRLSDMAERTRSAIAVIDRDEAVSDRVRTALLREAWRVIGSGYGYLQAVSDIMGLTAKEVEAWSKYMRGDEVPKPKLSQVELAPD